MRTLQEWMSHRDFQTTLRDADYAPSNRESEWIETRVRRSSWRACRHRGLGGSADAVGNVHVSMALPTSYLTTSRNLDGILAAMQTAQAPQAFNRRFLEGLDYKSSSDRLIINVLKALGFLSGDNTPTERYYEFLDQSQSGRVMAEGLREAYADLYAVNTKAHTLPKADVKNKLRTLSRGQFSEGVLDKMAMTFLALAKHADFEAADQRGTQDDRDGADQAEVRDDGDDTGDGDDRGDDAEQWQQQLGDMGNVRLGGLVYNIQIQLPESRDQAVYDALFRSLKSHLLK